MISADGLRELLEELQKKTAAGAAVKPPVYRIGDKAEERRVRDDLKSGRQQMRSANRCALTGIDALNSGETDSAKTYYEIAKGFYIEALERLVRPSERAALGKSAGRRGRPKKTEK